MHIQARTNSQTFFIFLKSFQYICAVLLNGQTAGTGTGKSKKEAEQAAARAALQALQ